MIRFAIVCLWLALCFPFVVLAQTEDKRLDELRKMAAKNQDLSSYTSVCSYLSQKEQYPELLLLYSDSIYRISVRNQIQEGIMAHYSFRAEACFMQGNYASGFHYKMKALNLAEQENNQK